jgi:hypothetical protein
LFTALRTTVSFARWTALHRLEIYSAAQTRARAYARLSRFRLDGSTFFVNSRFPLCDFTQAGYLQVPTQLQFSSADHSYGEHT